MRFYKVVAFNLVENMKDEDRNARRERVHKVLTRTAQFNGANTERFCCVHDHDEEFVNFCIIATENVNIEEFVMKYASAVGLEVSVEMIDEITFSSFRHLLSNADRCGYIEDEDEVLERFGLDRITGMRGGGIEFGENLVNTNSKREELFASATKLFTNETLIPELERIYEGAKRNKVMGHPVHYVVESDDCDARRDIYKILLDALYANGRIVNSRYSFLNFRPGERYSKSGYEALYRMSDGGAVVVRYLAKEENDDGENASGERDMIEHICDVAKRYRNKVLTILCFPRECKIVKSRFNECLGTMSFIDLREDFIDSAKAKCFLSSLASEKHVRIDKKLLAHIQVDRDYLATELVCVFDDWYNQKLKTTVYPQYKDVTVARSEVANAKPRGSAYDELMEMIGLDDAKRVIKKALNYYKMQNLYAENGVKIESPAMHMIFSGNPGTAKTTVARLFACIMRENRLLSRGHLIEVGRGDLVGKYVGWTAQTVKARFKDAVGGVLFIDEAYSLVDDRDGSYGDEAINTIVQEMENHRKDVVVIFAGYPDKMESFLQKNPGLRSRIAFHVPFADYNSDELCRIAKALGRKNGMKLDGEAIEKLEKVFEIARRNSDFGNGRYVRNVFEQAKMNQASRLLEKDICSVTADEIITITADDIDLPKPEAVKSVSIGFC